MNTPILPQPLAQAALERGCRYDGFRPGFLMGAKSIQSRFQFTDVRPGSPGHAGTFSALITATPADFAAAHEEMLARCVPEPTAAVAA